MSNSSRRPGRSAPSRARIIFRHIVPNVLSVVIVYLTLTIPRVMLFEAFLSFLGLGCASAGCFVGIAGQCGIQGDHADQDFLVAVCVSRRWRWE